MMRKIQGLFNHIFLYKLRIPDYIGQEFVQEAVRKNNFSLSIICFIIFVTELFNIARVLFWSKSGLGTWNNQIYFLMYCSLIFLAVLWLALRRPLQRSTVCAQWAAQCVLSGVILLWHMGLNTYDLYRDPSAGTTVLTTALMGLALLIQSPPWYSIMQIIVDYLLFRVVMGPLLDSGDRLNMTITFVVALAVSLANAHQTSVMLQQQKRVLEINDKLQELIQRDPLTGLLNKTTVECWAEQVLHGLEYTGRSSGLTLFLFDLDEFKRVNDCYGHPCGDYVLVETAEAMRCIFPDAAGLGRIGGDEFAILYDRPMTDTQAIAQGQKFVKQLGKIQWKGSSLGIQCSVGVCVCMHSRYTYQQLYTKTDQMLYRAKKTGKGRCCVCQLDCAENKRFEGELV